MNNKPNNPGGSHHHSNRDRFHHHHHSSSSSRHPHYSSSQQQQRPPSQSHHSHYTSQNYYQGGSSSSNVGGGGSSSSTNFQIPRRSPPPLPPPSSSTNPAATSLSIPRKSHHPPPPPPLASSKPTKFTGQRIFVESECPFVLRIKTSGLNQNQGYPSSFTSGVGLGATSGSTSSAAISGEKQQKRESLRELKSKKEEKKIRSSSRTPKRKLNSYAEVGDLEDTDSEVSDEEKIPDKKRIKKANKQQQDENSSGDKQPLKKQRRSLREISSATKEEIEEREEKEDALATLLAPIEGAPVDPQAVDAPPPGVLPSLWYSRECVLHVYVIEKILGWKSRSVTTLEPHIKAEEEEEEFGEKRKFSLDAQAAEKLKDKALEKYIQEPTRRMEISRINPTQCPVILSLAAEKEKEKYKLMISKTNREEVYLIKWRGKSHIHCSWERKRDLEKFDPSNNTARGKVKRYVQSQEALLGKQWRKLVEEERKAVSAPATHAHGHAHTKEEEEKKKEEEEETVEEEFFLPSYAEVERVLACDESELDLNVLARQRALNIKAEREKVRLKEEEEENQEGDKAKEDSKDSSSSALVTTEESTRPQQKDEEDKWDPEDNVRYVIKWKGLQFQEMTWEYWRDIKYDFVDQVEDFWLRQRAPTQDDVAKILARKQPKITDFKKLTESPQFGVCGKKRPVAKLEGETDVIEEVEDDESGYKLRVYQLEGVNWLLWNWWNRRSCILADEMGLGKTIQSVGFLQELQRQPLAQVRGPFLIVAPLSLIAQWQSETEAWAPDMNVILYHGSADSRDFLVKQEFYYTDQFIPKTTAQKLRRQHITKFHVLITTYEVVLKDVAVLSKIKWKALIVDEAHRLKNPKSRLFVELATVPRDFCVLLTGTPLQNSTEELWALLHFSDPVAFSSKEEFVNKFGQLTDAHQVSELHSVLKPYLLRRVKEDVEKSLPPKEETILEVTLTPIQKTYYKAIYERNTNFLFKGAKPSNAPSLMNIMMELRKCCNHPFLIRGAEERILADACAAEGKKITDETTAIDNVKLSGEQLVKSSGKMVLLVKLLPKLYAGGHKVLIFSQMVRVLDLLEELLRMKHYRYERLDGSTSASSRAAAVDRFGRKSFQRFVMLLSTRAGGLGLNLTAADTVIIFDSDWNPQNDLQAMARAHRIGQTRAVRVYRLLTSKTYEMHMFHSASMKLGLDRAVLAHQRQHGAEDDDDPAKSKSKSKKEREIQAKEIDELLKKGAYDVFRDDDDKEAQQFMETDIDQLLERSSRKVTYGNTSTTSISSGLGSFSKASFVASTDDGKDVDLDDPDFWEKAVGLDAPAESADENSKLLVDEKRNRRQVQVFDPYAAFAEAEQKKKDKIAQKAKEEKEEKKRLKAERKQRKKEEKEKKKRKKEGKESKDKIPASNSVVKKQSESDKSSTKEKKVSREGRSKKMKKAERRRAIRKAEREDPILERIKQAWEVPQRNRASAAALRFGFGRFCKIRNDANLTSLPIQDLEVFVRAYVYQLALQAAVSLLEQLQDRADSKVQGLVLDSMDAASDIISSVLSPLSESGGGPETEWICNAMMTSLKLYEEAKTGRCSLRIPLCLAEPTFVSELRAGAAFRALRRFAFLSRLNSVVENALDQILDDLGHEELGKRGCPTKDLSTLDADLKSRHVTTEELSHSLGIHLPHPRFCRDCAPPAPWWDRSCDLALIVGTFIHGLGNYEAMRLDEDLPFGRKISQYAANDPGTAKAFHTFEAAAYSARKVFDDALSNARLKAQAEAHAAVAAAVAASKLAEQEAKEARDAKSEGSNNTDPLRKSTTNKDSSKTDGKGQNLSTSDDKASSTIDTDDSDVITLSWLSTAMAKTTFSMPNAESLLNGSNMDGSSSTSKSSNAKKKTAEKQEVHLRLPMPDARCLDHLLSCLINKIEGRGANRGFNDTDDPGIDISIAAIISTDKDTRRSAVLKLLDRCNSSGHKHRECVRVAFSGSLCGSHHRNLDDAADYFLGAASADLLFLSSGADASRYQRGTGVPTILTRYGLAAIIHADEDLVQKMAAIKASDDASPPQQSTSAASTNGETSSDAPKKIVEKTGLQYAFGKIPTQLKDNELYRAGLCAALLHCGSPVDLRKENRDEVDYRLSNILQGREKSFFTMKTLIDIGGLFSSDQHSPIEEKKAKVYYNSVLIPHCINLCLSRTGFQPSTSKGNPYDTAVVDEKLPKNYFSTLPDPSLPLHLHSEVAVANALAILRRIRLTRAIRFVVGGGIPLEQLMSFLNGPVMRTSLDGVPVWWKPSVHDLALLAHAAVYGLFAIISDRTNQEKMANIQSVFCISAIKKHIREVFVEGIDGKKPALPRNFLDGSKSGEVDAWVEAQALQFPTPNVIERRIAIICGEMTQDVVDGTDDGENANKGDTFYKYASIPMFDHGGWPKDVENGCGTLGLYSGTRTGAVFASLLHVAEGWYDHGFRQSW